MVFVRAWGVSSVDVAQSLSSLLQKNKPEPYAASRDFINAILCAERPILSKELGIQEQQRGLTVPLQSQERYAL
jgi:hypothetical protein